jgi:hypothetical protein
MVARADRGANGATVGTWRADARRSEMRVRPTGADARADRGARINDIDT